MSSSVTGRISLGAHGSRRRCMWAIASSRFSLSSYSLSLYMRSSMNIRSSDAKWSCSLTSPSCISSSFPRIERVCSTLWRSTSLTPMKWGFFSDMTQQLGDTDTSQSVNAYRASMVRSLDVPGSRCTSMLAVSAVLSSTLRIFIFPLSKALSIDSMSVAVVLP